MSFTGIVIACAMNASSCNLDTSIWNIQADDFTSKEDCRQESTSFIEELNDGLWGRFRGSELPEKVTFAFRCVENK